MKINSLNNRIDVYSKQQIENELGELDYSYSKLKTIWASIKPTTGNFKTGDGNIIQVDIKFKITIRADSLREITNDMYFIYQDKKYNIDYYIPNFEKKDSIDIYCTVEDVK